jgi:hypothetical protein
MRLSLPLIGQTLAPENGLFPFRSLMAPVQWVRGRYKRGTRKEPRYGRRMRKAKVFVTDMNDIERHSLTGTSKPPFRFLSPDRGDTRRKGRSTVAAKLLLSCRSGGGMAISKAGFHFVVTDYFGPFLAHSLDAAKSLQNALPMLVPIYPIRSNSVFAIFHLLKRVGACDFAPLPPTTGAYIGFSSDSRRLGKSDTNKHSPAVWPATNAIWAHR